MPGHSERIPRHIFCTECAARLGLTDPNERQLCPACSSPLANPDDAVVTNLNPSEDYKTSVLSGLSPTIIIECASRALSFWAYQTTQEVVYQECFGRTLTEKYSNLTVHLEKVIGEANNQITALNHKITNLSFDQQSLHRKNDELTQALKDKNKKFMQTQELYDKLKRKAMMGQMQHAAEDAVDLNLHTATGGPRPQRERLSLRTYEDVVYKQRPSQHSNGNGPGSIYPAQATHQTNHEIWDKGNTGGLDIPLTPSTYRQRISQPSGIGLSTVPGLVAGPRSPRQRLNNRAPLSELSTNARNNDKFPAIGLSSGLKSSHNGGGPNAFVVPTTRPHAIQRPIQNPSVLSRGELGHHPESALGNIQSATVMGGVRRGFTPR
ncbi:hypothetical protein TruAng_010911 [Truncatella angustata]|nr:hypothetical protein TruAng_010911 [Truncatella angustata]